MANYVYQGYALNDAKQNRAPLPGGEDPNKWIQAAEDWNPAMQASLDLRNAVINGELHGLAAQVVRPAPTTPYSPYFLWVRDADKHLIYTVSGVDNDLSASASGTLTLDDAYSNGVAGPQIITLDATRLGIEVDIDGTLGAGDAAFAVGDSSLLDPVGQPMNYLSVVDGAIKGYNDIAFRHRIDFWGGGAATLSDIFLSLPDAQVNPLPAGNFIIRAQNSYAGMGTTAGHTFICGGKSPSNALGESDGIAYLASPTTADGGSLTPPYFGIGRRPTAGEAAGPGAGGDVGNQSFGVASTKDLGSILGLEYFGAGGFGISHNGNNSFNVTEATLSMLGYIGTATVVDINTSASRAADATYPLLDVHTTSLDRLKVFGSPYNAVKMYGTINDTAGAQLWIVATTEVSAYHGCIIKMDNTLNTGAKWRLANIKEDLGYGVDSFYIIGTEDVTGGGIVLSKAAGGLYPFQLATLDLGSTGHPWRTAYLSTSVITPTIGTAAGTQHALPGGTAMLLSGAVTATFVPYATGAGVLADMALSYDSAQKILTLESSTIANGQAPLILRSPVATTIGTAICLDATNAGGHTWSWISTGTAPAVGPNILGAYDSTAAGYIFLIDTTAIFPAVDDALSSGKVGLRWAKVCARRILSGGSGTNGHVVPNVADSTFALLGLAQTYTKSQNVASVALSDGANIATDASLSNTFTVTLGGNRTLDNPTNLVSGGTYVWIIRQDGSAPRTLAYGNLFKFPGGTTPTLSTGNNEVDMLCAVYDGTQLNAVLQKDFS